MLIDGTLIFTASPVAITSSTVNSSAIDLTGLGSGTVSTNIIGNASTFGFDPGVGRWAQQIYITISTAFTTSNSCNLTVQLAAAPDSSGSPGTYSVIAQTGAYVVANLTKGQVIPMNWVRLFPPTLNPRFFRLQYVPSATFTAGDIGYAAVTSGRPDFQSMQQSASNYVVA